MCITYSNAKVVFNVIVFVALVLILVIGVATLFPTHSTWASRRADAALCDTRARECVPSSISRGSVWLFRGGQRHAWLGLRRLVRLLLFGRLRGCWHRINGLNSHRCLNHRRAVSACHCPSWRRQHAAIIAACGWLLVSVAAIACAIGSHHQVCVREWHVTSKSPGCASWSSDR